MENDCLMWKQSRWFRRRNGRRLSVWSVGVMRCLIGLLVTAVIMACSPDSGGHRMATGPCHASGSPSPFTIATYNIHAGVGHDRSRDLERIAATLAGTEVVGLQEVDNGRVRSGFENQARTLAGLLKHEYWQHFPAEDYWPFGTYGVAAISSLRVVASGGFDLPMIEGKPLRRLGWIKVLVECRPIHVFIIHATRVDDSMDSVQAVQIEAAWRILSEKSDALREPVVLLGDFNANFDSQVMRWLRERMIDVINRQAPERSATVPLDYILVKGDLEVLRVEVRNSAASDHPAVVATLQWKENARTGW